MFAVRVELLAGWYVATRHDDRRRPEWPPHPARLFSALVAAWADAETPDLAERAALEWLETLGAPSLTCSSTSEVSERSAVTHFVADNDPAVVGDLSLLGRVYDQLLASPPAALVSADAPAVEARRAERAAARLALRVEQVSAKATAPRPSESHNMIASGLAVLPDHRGRQARWFPSVVPADPLVWYTWEHANAPESHFAALGGLLARVGRLGHSSSLVYCELTRTAPEPTLLPDAMGPLRLRVAAPGLLRLLEDAHQVHRGCEPRTLPATWVSYDRADARPPAQPPLPLLSGRWYVLAIDERRVLPLRRTLEVARAARETLLAHSDRPVSEILSGHVPGPAGKKTPPSQRPHLAVVPLAFVGVPYADGTIQGLALVLPGGASDHERASVASAIRGWRAAGTTLSLGRAGHLRLALVDELDASWSLRQTTWCRPARTWVTVTPIVLDRFPKGLTDRSPERHLAGEAHAAETIAQSCVHAGLPRPARVVIRFDAPLRGVPPLRDFPPYRVADGRPTRLSVHATIHFDEQVRGPVLVGAGRYLGRGLCFPVDDDH